MSKTETPRAMTEIILLVINYSTPATVHISISPRGQLEQETTGHSFTYLSHILIILQGVLGHTCKMAIFAKFHKRNCGERRPLSVSFQFRASGKETDVATPLGLEKYGKVDFTLGKLTKRHPKNGQK